VNVTHRVCMTFWEKHKHRIKRILLLGLVLLIPFLAMRVPAVRRALVDLVAFMRETPLQGITLFLVVETFALLVTTPTWLMSGLAGYAYGFAWGFVLAWPALIVCASLVFLIGRLFAQKYVAARSAETHFWKAVDRAAGKDGFKVALLMRLAVALPQNLITYMLSATSIKLRDFVLGSFLGYMPATIVHVYVGSNVESAAALISGESSNRGPGAWMTVTLGFVLTVTALIIVSRYARRALDEALAEGARATGQTVA
jgi:uncharacterized membrane protein YdjX (TVP38/TMEM64 family)